MRQNLEMLKGLLRNIICQSIFAEALLWTLLLGVSSSTQLVPLLLQARQIRRDTERLICMQV
jgi:hypothetical protein